jgi:Ca2+-binding EF-hand superfamily protein
MTVRILLVLVAIGLVLGGSAAEQAARPMPAAAGRDVQDLVFFADDRPVLIRLHVRIDGRPFRDLFEAAMGEYLQSLFRYLDRNGDGVLTEAEARRCPPPLMALPGVSPETAGAVNVAFNFRALDTDGDGKVTFAELADYYRQYEGAGFQARLHGTPLPQADALNEALFSRLDVKKAGKLSRQDLAAAPAALLKLDVNDDEMVSAREVAPQLFPAVNPLEVQPAPLTRMLVRREEAFFVVTPGEAPADLAEAILTRYGPKVKDVRGKKLDRQDVALDRATFDRLDRNKDGRLDGTELEKFTARPPDVELLIRLGRRGKGEAVLDVLRPTGSEPLAASVRRPLDGEVVLTLGNAQVELRCNRGGLRSDFLARMKETYLEQFRIADVDGNGVVDRKEARQSRFFREVFDRMDRNGDGRLERAELLDYLDRVLTPQARAMANRTVLVMSDAGRGLFDLLDQNRDGRLGLRELRALPGLLARLDRNGDGHLDRSEIPRSFQLALGRGQASLNRATGNVLVVSPDGTLAHAADSQMGGPTWFRKMDRNGDGDVSPREFLGSRAEFKRLDTDGDGLISVEEAEQAEALRNRRKGK